MKGKLLLIIKKRTVIAMHNITCIIYIFYTDMFYETGDVNWHWTQFKGWCYTRNLVLMKITKFLGLWDEEVYIKCFKKIFVDYGNIDSFFNEQL